MTESITHVGADQDNVPNDANGIAGESNAAISKTEDDYRLLLSYLLVLQMSLS